jgi:hypothetical protein
MKKQGTVLPLQMSEGFVSNISTIGSWYDFMPKLQTGTVLDTATLYVRCGISTLALGAKRVFYYHGYGDSPRYGESIYASGYGFLEGDGVPTPMMTAYAVMTNQLEDKTYVQSGKVGSVWYHVFQGAGGIVAVAWSDFGVKSKVVLPLQVVAGTNFMGNAAQFQDGGNSVTVTLDRTPVYLKLKALPTKKLAVAVVPR